METINQNRANTGTTPTVTRNSKGRVFGGLLIVLVGVFFLLREMGVDLPRWLFSFEMLLIVLGVYIGVRHSFRGFLWLVPVIIGGLLLVDDLTGYDDLHQYIWPMLIIGFGLFMMFRAGRKNDERSWEKWENEQNRLTSGEDYLDSTVIFGGAKKHIISKTFKGGEAVTVFGGTEINLTQADVSGKIILDLTQVFGGTKLIVPPNWKIQADEMVSIFGGVEDKRPLLSDTSIVDHNKVLVLKGTSIFGGIDIKSY